MIRAALRRWLGVPSRLEVRAVARAITLAEIDADEAWKTGPHHRGNNAVRRSLDVQRDGAIFSGQRENTHAEAGLRPGEMFRG